MNDMMNTDDYRGRNYRNDYYDDGYHGRNYRRSYDRRGGRINYRNYREESYYEELENSMYELKEISREIEDVAEMAENPQDRNMLMKIAQKEKEHSMQLKQMMEK